MTTDFARTRALFHIPEGVIYLDGNSLGPLPNAAAERVSRMMTAEWGELLIRGWNAAGWFVQPRKLGDRETGGGLALPVWIEYMAQALKGVPVSELTPPEGVIFSDGDWVFDEYSRGAGVRSLGLEDVVPQPPTPEERSSILDLFRR